MPVKLPKWSDEPEVLDLITRWFDKIEWNDVMEQARSDDEIGYNIFDLRSFHDALLHPTPSRSDLIRMLRSGEEIGPRNRAHIANLLERDAPKQKRGRGKPPRPKEERAQESIKPEVEALCASVINFLKLTYPKETVENINYLAAKWTLAKIQPYLLPKQKKKWTEDTLLNYMGRYEKAPQRLSPKPRSRR